MKENGRQDGARPGAAQFSSAPPKPAPAAASSVSRSRLPSPPQPGARRPSASPPPPCARRPSPPPPLSARGPAPQLRLKPPASSADDPTPRNFARAPLTARGAPPGTAAAARRDGSLTARRPPGSSYRDALARSSSTFAAGLATPRGASNLPAPPARRPAAPPADPAAAPAASAAAPDVPPLPTAARQQQLEVTQQLARASHEQEQLQQHVRRLEAGLEAQQAELQSRLAAVQMLSERREALAEHSATLQRLCLQAKVVEESRRAELQSLGLASDAARLSLERYQAQGEGSVAALAAARSQLLHMMQSASHALKLPELAAGIQRELRATSGAADGGSSAAIAALPAAAAAPALAAPAAASAAAGVPAAASAAKPRGAACPASPSDAGTRGYATPAGSAAGSPASSCSDWSDRDSCSSTVSSPRQEGSGASGDVVARLAAPAASRLAPQAARQRGPPLPPLRLTGLDAAAAGSADGSRSSRIPKSVRIPGAALVSPPPAEPPAGGAASCPVSPQVLQRLQSISSKLEAALADQALEVDSV